MRVLYDGMIYSMQKAGGISRYFNNIMDLLDKKYKPTLIKESWAKPVSLSTNERLKIYNLPQVGLNKKLSKFINKYTFYKVCRAISKTDLLHPTYYQILSYQYIKKQKNLPLVITVYDMIHELIINKIDPDGANPHIELKKRALDAAEHIICISENTKNDLLKIYPELNSKKISVIYLASWINQLKTSLASPIQGDNGFKSNYFLYVGSRDKAYKNFDVFLKAFAKVSKTKSITESMIYVVGTEFTQEEQELIYTYKLDKQIKLFRNIDDNKLYQLYQNSLALVDPSAYEGFGIPPLEAMMCGTLVIANNIASLPEVVGKSGILLSNLNENNLAEALDNVINMPSLKRQQLVDAGYRQAEKFDWHRTVQKTQEIYDSCV
jgi:glycosyltransferase involved in cell wall biosynthesis